jgi:hypothetical protein
MGSYLPNDVLINQITHQLGLNDLKRFLRENPHLPPQLLTDDDLAFELRRPGSQLQSTVNAALNHYVMVLQLRYDTQLQQTIAYYEKEVRRIRGEIEHEEKEGKTNHLSLELRFPTRQTVHDMQMAAEVLTKQHSLLSLQLLAQPRAFYIARTAEFDLAMVASISNLRSFVEQTFGNDSEYEEVKSAMLSHIAETEARYNFTMAQTPEMITARLLASQQFAVAAPTAIVPPAPKYTGRKETPAEQNNKARTDLPMLDPEVVAMHALVTQLLMRQIHAFSLGHGLKKSANLIHDPSLRMSFIEGLQGNSIGINSVHDDAMRAFKENMMAQHGQLNNLNRVRIHTAAEAEIVKNRVGYGMHTPLKNQNRQK